MSHEIGDIVDYIVTAYMVIAILHAQVLSMVAFGGKRLSEQSLNDKCLAFNGVLMCSAFWPVFDVAMAIGTIVYYAYRGLRTAGTKILTQFTKEPV